MPRSESAVLLQAVGRCTQIEDRACIGWSDLRPDACHSIPRRTSDLAKLENSPIPVSAWPASHLYYSWYLVFNGRFPEAYQQLDRAQALDPLSLTLYITSGQVYYWARDYERAVQQLKKAEELDPTDTDTAGSLGNAYLAKNMCSEATQHYIRAEELEGETKAATALGKAFATSGCKGTH